MFGAIYGDIVGSVYEFNNIYTKKFPMFSPDSTFTDDTVMTLAVAKALLDYDASPGGDINLFKELLIDEMHKLGRKFPDAGYGTRFLGWLYEESREPYGSYGNGAAMRVSPVAWYAKSLKDALILARASAEVTHDHPEGVKGAQAVAGAIYLARTGESMEKIRNFALGYYSLNFTLDEIRYSYSFNETCQQTVPQALVAFFEATSFEDAIRNAISIGGDSDTLAAITGSVAEAFFGMKESEKEEVTKRLCPSLLKKLNNFSKFFM